MDTHGKGSRPLSRRLGIIYIFAHQKAEILWDLRKKSRDGARLALSATRMPVKQR